MASALPMTLPWAPFVGAPRPLAHAGAVWALVAAGLAAVMYRGYAAAGDVRFGAYPPGAGDSAVVRALQAGSGPMIEVPVGVIATQGRPDFQPQALYGSIFRWRPLLNGYSNYWPAAFPARMEPIGRLPEAQAPAALVRATGLATIVVHLADFGVPQREACERDRTPDEIPAECRVDFGAGERAPWLALAEQGGRGDLRFVLHEGDDLLFEVRAPGGPT